MFTCTCPLSSVHGTRKINTRSGSTIRSTMAAFSNSGCMLYTSSIEVSTSLTACKNSCSPGCLISRRVITSFTFIRLKFRRMRKGSQPNNLQLMPVGLFAFHALFYTFIYYFFDAMFRVAHLYHLQGLYPFHAGVFH